MLLQMYHHFTLMTNNKHHCLLLQSWLKNQGIQTVGVRAPKRSATFSLSCKRPIEVSACTPVSGVQMHPCYLISKNIPWTGALFFQMTVGLMEAMLGLLPPGYALQLPLLALSKGAETLMTTVMPVGLLQTMLLIMLKSRLLMKNLIIPRRILRSETI